MYLNGVGERNAFGVYAMKIFDIFHARIVVESIYPFNNLLKKFRFNENLTQS